ncbi:hypothetical protein MC885_009218 [Smutsia gigantea]|nr:hypothetical protein MC885_009218 [Smutsia gigantea]
MRFEKVFENAIDPGAVVDILESFLTRFELIQLVPPVWEELASYEENTRDFLFPEPKLTPSYPGVCRQVLMKTVAGFPVSDPCPAGLLGIAPQIEFSTRTAIRERVFLHRERFLEERYKSQRPLLTSYGPKFPLNDVKMKLKESNLNRLPQGMQSEACAPYSTRCFFQDQPAWMNPGNSFKISEESKPPFVVRHVSLRLFLRVLWNTEGVNELTIVDSTKPFGETISELHSPKSRRKSKFSDFPFPMRRGTEVSSSSFDSLAANIKVIKEPDERIVLRNESPSSLDSSKLGKPLPRYSNQGDADFHQGTSFATFQHSRSPSPLLDQPFL